MLVFKYSHLHPQLLLLISLSYHFHSTNTFILPIVRPPTTVRLISQTMGCTPSKESTPRKSKRAILYGSDTNPSSQRYLSDPAPKHVKFASSTNFGKPRLGKAAMPKETIDAYPRRGGTKRAEAQPKETFEAYAQRGLIRQSALLPEGVQSARTQRRPQMKSARGYQKYMAE